MAGLTPLHKERNEERMNARQRAMSALYKVREIDVQLERDIKSYIEGIETKEIKPFKDELSQFRETRQRIENLKTEHECELKEMSSDAGNEKYHFTAIDVWENRLEVINLILGIIK